MNADQVSLLLVVAAVPPVNLFLFIYGFALPWYRTHIGRSLIISSLGLAALVDISFLYRIMGDEYQGRDAARIVAFSIVVLGAWYQFIAFMAERRRGRKIIP